MFKHPEQRPNEIYIGNAYKGPAPWFKPLKTIRLGDVAYDLDGHKLRGWLADFEPMFINKSERRAWADIMMDMCGNKEQS